ncbi:MAG: hypothetical protein P4L33_04375 [Capsulimonadaceae bacterium]|nr:hypothetical protein [Capsulimonadaceae bacterium]
MGLTDGFELRVESYNRKAAEAAAAFYDREGNWIGASAPLQVRERYWLSLALYATGQTSWADAVIRKGDLTVSHLGIPRKDGSHFDIFHSNVAVICLLKFGQVMAPDVRQLLTGLVAEAIGPKGGDRLPEYQYHGYNDNMPSKAALGLILGGDLIGDAGAVAHGIANLRELRAMLVRRGTISEYNSPTYSAVTLHALAEIAENAKSAEARELARDAETRLWVDLAARFHPEMGCIVGPHSRAYTVDSLASVTCLGSLFWFTFGDIAKPSPMALFDNDPELVVHHAGDYLFNIAQMCWFASGKCHMPEIAAPLFQTKAYPFRAAATYEMGDSGPDFPARADSIVSFLERDYALGTAGTGWLTGDPSVTYFVTYKQRQEVRSHRDVGTVFTKMLVNDQAQGIVSSSECGTTGEEDNVRSNAGCLTVQSDSTALVLTYPHLSLAAPADSAGGTGNPLHRLNEMVIFPAHYASADEIIVGNDRRSRWEGAARSGEWIACRRGRLLIAVHPIAYSREFGQASITLERINKYEVIRATFYEGGERQFTRDELRHVCGGFVAEHASVDEYPSLQAFVDDLVASRISDIVYTTRRSRYIRPKTNVRPALDIETSWSLASPTPRFVSVNGQVPVNPRVRIDGIREHELPYLDEAPVSTATAEVRDWVFPISWKAD